jgi:hypothetical protein
MFGSSFTWGDTTYNVGSVFDHLLTVESALLSGKALYNYS